MQQILAIQIKRIGDLILTAPALNRLKRELPESQLTLVTLGVAGQLVPAIPAVDVHLNYRYRRPNFPVWSRVARGGFDAALDFNGSDRSLLMTWLSRAEQRGGYTKRGRGFPRNRAYTATSDASLKELHTVDHMAALLETIGIPTGADSEPLSLLLPDESFERAGEILDGHGLDRPYAVIHPGTAREEKFWEIERWVEIADYLEESCGLRVVITGGNAAAEGNHVMLIGAQTKKEPIVVAAQMDLLETAATITRAEIVLGVDTAAMHLAAAFQKPQVVLFAETNPYHWGPRHENARVILAGHEEPVAIESLEQKIPRRRMKEITTEQVIAAIESLR